jgi:hypothetical protein
MRFVPWARAIVSGWVTLLAIAYLVEGPLIHLTAPLFGARWIATVELGFDCATLAAAGWVTGRLNRSRAIGSALLLAVTLCFWDFGGMLALNLPRLVQLLWDTVHDAQYLDSLVTSAETHVLLFGCLFAGAALSREREKMVSILE